MTPAEQWDATVRLFTEHFPDMPKWRTPDRFATSWELGLIVRKHKLFNIGDYIITDWWNGGGQRQPVYAVSSKGFKIVHYYVDYARYRKTGRQVLGNSKMKIIEPPADLVGRLPDDPDVRRHVVDMLSRAASAVQ